MQSLSEINQVQQTAQKTRLQQRMAELLEVQQELNRRQLERRQTGSPSRRKLAQSVLQNASEEAARGSGGQQRAPVRTSTRSPPRHSPTQLTSRVQRGVDQQKHHSSTRVNHSRAWGQSPSPKKKVEEGALSMTRRRSDRSPQRPASNTPQASPDAIVRAINSAIANSVEDAMNTPGQPQAHRETRRRLEMPAPQHDQHVERQQQAAAPNGGEGREEHPTYNFHAGSELADQVAPRAPSHGMPLMQVRLSESTIRHPSLDACLPYALVFLAQCIPLMLLQTLPDPHLHPPSSVAPTCAGAGGWAARPLSSRVEPILHEHQVPRVRQRRWHKPDGAPWATAPRFHCTPAVLLWGHAVGR
jgi:hypothetical protein